MMRTVAYAMTRKGADFRQVAEHGKDRERIDRSGTDRRRGNPADGAAGDFRELSTGSHREVGGKKRFSVGGHHTCLTVRHGKSPAAQLRR